MSNNSKEKEETKRFFLYGDRTFSVIGLKKSDENKSFKLYGFYRSTGICSNYPGTWFPMQDIAKPASKYPEGTILKPGHSITYLENNGEYTNDATLCFEPIFLKFVKNLVARNISVFTLPKKIVLFDAENPLYAFLYRFGNMECMLLSYLIGGGYWETEEAKPICRFIEHACQAQLKELKTVVGEKELNLFREPPKDFLNEECNTSTRGARMCLIDICSKFFSQQAYLCNYLNPKLKYEITNQVLLSFVKQELLLLCDDYNNHLVKRLNAVRASGEVVKQKLSALAELRGEINNETFDPNNLTEDFKNNLDVLEKDSDKTGIYILKCILTVLTFGVAAAFGLWKTKGSNVKEQLQKLMNMNMKADSEGTAETNAPPTTLRK